jgi:hypothetical protein
MSSQISRGFIKRAAENHSSNNSCVAPHSISRNHVQLSVLTLSSIHSPFPTTQAELMGSHIGVSQLTQVLIWDPEEKQSNLMRHTVHNKKNTATNSSAIIGIRPMYSCTKSGSGAQFSVRGCLMNWDEQNTLNARQLRNYLAGIIPGTGLSWKPVLSLR